MNYKKCTRALVEEDGARSFSMNSATRSNTYSELKDWYAELHQTPQKIIQNKKTAWFSMPN